jgi:hypothetical protein
MSEERNEDLPSKGMHKKIRESSASENLMMDMVRKKYRRLMKPNTQGLLNDFMV